jgi:WhiB family transcriptional regulator, redox-sensing transcriptional regulator
MQWLEATVGGIDTTGLRLDLPCTRNPELFFAESPEDVELAKAMCRGCRVRIACLTSALERREPWGVWGGELLMRGAIVPRKRPRGRPRKTEVAAEAATPTRWAARPTGAARPVPRTTRRGVIRMRTEQLAIQRTHSIIQEAEQLRYSRRLRSLRRARRLERKAERRLIEAWSRAAELRSAIESADY